MDQIFSEKRSREMCCCPKRKLDVVFDLNLNASQFSEKSYGKDYCSPNVGERRAVIKVLFQSLGFCLLGIAVRELKNFDR